MRQAFLIFLARSANSFTTTTPPARSSPLRKVAWWGEITLSMTPKSLPTKTLARSLYKDPTKEIGQKSSNSEGESSFGVKVTKREENPWGKEAN